MAAVLEELIAIPEQDIPALIATLEADDDGAMVDEANGAYEEQGERKWDTDDNVPLALRASAPAGPVTVV